MRTIGTHKKVLTPLKSNTEFDSTSHYKELNALQYHMILDQDKKKNSDVTY